MNLNNNVHGLVQQFGLRYLVIIGFGNYTDFLDKNTDFSDVPGSILASVEGETVPKGLSTLFFAPLLFASPTLTEEIQPHLRAVGADQKLTVSLSKYANFPEAVFDSDGSMGLSIKVQLWCPGTDFSEAVTIFYGRMESIRKNPQTETITIEARDGEPATRIEFPPNSQKLDASLFPNIPKTIDGVYSRRVFLGSVVFPISCPQVDQGTLFYVVDHSIKIRDTFAVEVNGIRRESGDPDFGWNIEEFILPGNQVNVLNKREVITLIRFNKQIQADGQFITVVGFDGVPRTKNPILILLQDYGGFKVADAAVQTINTLPLNEDRGHILSLMSQSPDDIISIVKTRLVPQTEFIFAWQRGEINLLPITGYKSGLIMRLGDSLYDIVKTDQIQKTSENDIINSIEIGYTRNIFMSTDFDITRQFIRLNYQNCFHDARLRGLLQTSQAKYGSKYFKMDFADLCFFTADEYKRYILDLATKILYLTHRQSTIYSFYAPWYPAISIPLNTVLKLDVPEYGLNMVAARVVQKIYKSYGMILSFQDEINPNF